MSDILELFEAAAKMHGHRCPGLAIGVRAAYIAQKHSGADSELYCVAEQKACFIDGIQSVSGATVGNGRLNIRLTGKAVFSFYDTASGEGIRLYFKGVPRVGDRPQQIQAVLTAPYDELFSIGKAHGEIPAYTPRGESQPCAQCGESTERSMLVQRDGKLLCSDCAAVAEVLI